MSLKAAIFQILMSMTPHHADTETPEERASRMEPVAESISIAARANAHRYGGTKLAAAALIAVGKHETHFSQWIGNNECSKLKTKSNPLPCDGGKAVGYWQSWSADKSEGVHGWANRALAHLSMAANYCTSGEIDRYKLVYRSVSLYATGNRCSWGRAHLRARDTMKYLERL